MNTLEQDLDLTLLELDRLRRRAAVLRDQGLKALWHLAEHDYQEMSTWLCAGGDIEKSLLIKTLGTISDRPSLPRDKKPLPQPLAEQLQLFSTFTMAKLRDDENGAPMPVFRAVRILQALFATPPFAVSEAAFHCFYLLVRELYSAHPPEWAFGAARAGERGPSTAFVTDDCIRAIVRYAHALGDLATFLGKLASIRSSAEALRTNVWLPDKWKRAEAGRLHLRLGALCGSVNLSLIILPPVEVAAETTPDALPGAIVQYCSNVLELAWIPTVKSSPNDLGVIAEPRTYS
jgi:hypothetical protein